MQPDLIIIGKIVAPHGVRGDVRVNPLTDFPERFLTMKQVLAGEQLLPLESAKMHKQFLLLKFGGRDDRNAVEELRGRLLYVPRSETVPLPAGEYYIFDLIGMDVYTTDGRAIGKVAEVLATGSNDVYVVERPSGRPLLVPALKTIVAELDTAAKRMVIADPQVWDADED
ncbi:MAG: ribosome maturation factor RimM [Sporomusaceae bacterium]|nr:ribosome maturation factor RimM [Sporomusaceae bacterium]